MNISINWLKKHLNLEGIAPDDIANKLTMSTVEVEGINPLAKQLENVFVGKIEKISKHPNADKLKLVEVNIGEETAQVVCGGTNLKKDMLIAFAKSGAMIRWHGEGEPIKLKSAKIRGEKSDGMICASDEIGLADLFPNEFGEILDLSSENLEVGKPLAEGLELDDNILDIDNKSLTNRPDLWGHYGIARELSAIYQKDLKEIKHYKIKEKKEIDLKLKIQEQKLCPAYFGIALSNIKAGPSPKWLRQALQAIGQKSINNIVDITNFVMQEMGQPIHAFDATKLKSPQIRVRMANPGEKLITLDNETRNLTEEMLVIADAEKPMALAGIMGGQNSEISGKTETIVIESANFDPINIRRTSMKLGLRTEASMRFEKGLDPTNALRALERVVELILEIQPEVRVVSRLGKFEKYKINQGPIKLPKDFLNKRIGQAIEDKTVENILERLGFEVKGKKEYWEVKVPSWRATGDISIKEDLVEEVSRIYGYDNIKHKMPEVKNEFFEDNKERSFERKIKDYLRLSKGLTEVYNYSFVRPEILEQLDLDHSDYWQLENPWDENENLMRKNLWPSLVMNIKNNLRFFDKVKIFELGRVFLARDGEFEIEPGIKKYLPAQPYFLAGAYTNEKLETPFYKIKEIINDMLDYLQIEYSLIKPGEYQNFQHPFRTAVIKVNDVEIGWITELHPLLAKKLEIDSKIGLWQIDFSALTEMIEPKYSYKQVSKYPAVVHDISLIIDEKLMYKDIAQVIKTVDPNIIKKVDLLDVFKNGKIKKGKKSITLRITYQSDEKTLEKDEVEKLQNKAVDQLSKALGAELRQ